MPCALELVPGVVYSWVFCPLLVDCAVVTGASALPSLYPTDPHYIHLCVMNILFQI